MNLIPENQSTFEANKNNDNRKAVSRKRRVSDYTLRKENKSHSSQNVYQINNDFFPITSSLFKGNNKTPKGGKVNLLRFIGEYRNSNEYSKKKSELEELEEFENKLKQYFCDNLSLLNTVIDKYKIRKSFWILKKAYKKSKETKKYSMLIQVYYMLKNNGENIRFRKFYMSQSFFTKKSLQTKTKCIYHIKLIQYRYREFISRKKSKSILKEMVKKFPSLSPKKKRSKSIKTKKTKKKKKEMDTKIEVNNNNNIKPITLKSNNIPTTKMYVIQNEEIEFFSTPKKAILDINKEKAFSINSTKKENTRYQSYTDKNENENLRASIFPNMLKHNSSSIKLIFDTPQKPSTNMKINYNDIEPTSLSSASTTLLNTNMTSPLSTLRKSSISVLKSIQSKRKNKKSRNKKSLIYLFSLYPSYTLIQILKKISKLTNKLKFLLHISGIIVKSIQEAIFYTIKNKGTKQSINFYYRTIKKHYELISDPSNNKNPKILIMKLFINNTIPNGDCSLRSWQFYHNKKEIEDKLIKDVYDKEKESKLILTYIKIYIEYYIDNNVYGYEQIFSCLANRVIREQLYINNYSIFGISRYIDNFLKRFFDGEFCKECFCMQKYEICRCNCHYDEKTNVINEFYQKTHFNNETYINNYNTNCNEIFWNDDFKSTSYKKEKLDQQISKYNKGFKDNIGFISLLLGKEI